MRDAEGAPAVAIDPARLSAHYQRFRVSDRVLLTGHSHQAWPDVARQAVLEAFDDAAEHVDHKWGRALAKAQRVREALLARMDDVGGDLALAASTHDLLVRLLSALDLARRPRLITTDGEFHTIRRQLSRLSEAGVECVGVPAEPAHTVAERLAAAVDERCAAVLVSRVFFESGAQAGDLRPLVAAASRAGAIVVVDAYHAVNAVDFSIRREGLEDTYVLGGGYKYLQLGEGNCFLRYPQHTSLRPVVTGWFADFGGLAQPSATIRYGSGPGERFAGATYDPTSHYRAAAVLDFFHAQGLTVSALRANVLRQLSLLREGLATLTPSGWRLSERPLVQGGAFLVLETPHAAHLAAHLESLGVHTDYRASRLRLGPAPYVTDQQLAHAVEAIARYRAP